MKITIPKEYMDRFENIWFRPKDGRHCIVQNVVFITRWENHSLVLMNDKERDRLLKCLKNEISQKSKISAFARLVEAGIINEIISENILYLPDYLAEWLGKGELNFKENELGLLISTTKPA
ncbi:MAG: hypothetical protein WC349_05315 [Patescibacteria group bacterium]|jgi:hypothetical protein